MFFLGQLHKGIYEEPPFVPLRDDQEDPEDANPDMIAQIQALEDAIAGEEGLNIKHKAVKVPRVVNPFEGRPAQEEFFRGFLQRLADDEYIPPNHTFLPWEEREMLKVGKREVEVILSAEVWVPRAIMWVRALEAFALCEARFGDAE